MWEEAEAPSQGNDGAFDPSAFDLVGFEAAGGWNAYPASSGTWEAQAAAVSGWETL